MSIWRDTRAELAGAWRSIKYDAGRRGSGSTAELSRGGSAYPEYDAFTGGPRRIITSAGMAALVLGRALGGYFGVVNGLGALLEPASAPDTPKLPGASGGRSTAATAPGRESWWAGDGGTDTQRPRDPAPAAPLPAPAPAAPGGYPTPQPPIPSPAPDCFYCPTPTPSEPDDPTPSPSPSQSATEQPGTPEPTPPTTPSPPATSDRPPAWHFHGTDGGWHRWRGHRDRDRDRERDRDRGDRGDRGGHGRDGDESCGRDEGNGDGNSHDGRGAGHWREHAVSDGASNIADSASDIADGGSDIADSATTGAGLGRT